MKINRRAFIEASAITVAAGLMPSVLGQATTSRRNPVNSLTANDAKIDALIASMTLEEKIGQMIQAEQNSPARLRLHDQGRCWHDHAVIQQLERGQMFRQQTSVN